MRNHGARERRFTWAALVATSMTVCVVPMGCGSIDEYAVVPTERMQPTLPVSTVEALAACAKSGAGRLERHSYEIGFEVHLSEEGRVQAVWPKGAQLEDESLEACLMDALQAMPPSEQFLEDVSVSSISRGVRGPTRVLVGTTALLPSLVELAPVVVTGSGVTIVVVVAVLVVAAVAVSTPKATKKDCENEKKRITLWCLDWFEKPNPPINVVGRSLAECVMINLSVECGGAKGKGKDDKYVPQPGRRY